MFEKSVLKTKAVIQPVFICITHLNVFMGPCRYGVGEELTYEYDLKRGKKMFEFFREDISSHLDRNYCTLREPVFLEWHEDFIVSEDTLKEITRDNDNVDLYLISGTNLLSYVSTIIAKRTHKPLAFCPLTGSKIARRGGVDASAHLFALEEGYEVYNALDYEELNTVVKALRTRRALKEMKILYGIFNAPLSFGVVSSFTDLEVFRKKFGTEITTFPAMNLFKDLDNISEEDDKEARELADQLLSEANSVHLPAENVVNDCRWYVLVKRMLEKNACNGFTMPCFEICATRELYKRHFTFCLTHSLMKDDGVPSACAADVNAIVCKAILMCMTRKAPYMGNVSVCLDDPDHKQMKINHDQACRYMKGYDAEPLPIDYVSFTKGNWGATMRYDFGRDSGEKITLINLSPNMKKIMIVKGTLNGCDDVLTPECVLAPRFTVADNRDYHRKSVEFGHHFCLVYGDHAEELKQFAEVAGLETVIA